MERWLGEIWDGGSGGGVGGKGPCLLCLPSALLHRPAVGRGRQRPALEIQDSTIALFWSAQPLTNQDCWEQTLLFFFVPSLPLVFLICCVLKNIFIETSSPPPARPLPPNLA